MPRPSPSSAPAAAVGLALAIVLALAALTVPASGATRAQDASPAAGPVSRDVPTPEECVGERPPLETIPTAAPTADTETEAGTPAVSTTPFAPPAGEPADPATVEAITATLRGNLACLNAGDTLRSFAFYTDAYLVGLLAAAGVPELRPDYYDALATPFPLPPSRQTSLDAVEEVVVLPDGRVGALVTTTNLDTTVNHVVFAPTDDGRYLIDELTQVGVSGATPVASPPT